MTLALLDSQNPDQPFPDPEQALDDPNGLLAVGGCLSPQRIINAYRQGIFPWYNPGEPVLWWSPDPRLVLFPDKLKISRSLQKKRRKNIFTVSFNRDFRAVIEACAQPRDKASGTWITEEIKLAYQQLHELGIAQSIEVWHENELVGGLYGLALGRVFFGESMFHRMTDASKIGFVTWVEYLQSQDYQLIDCQVYSEHLVSLGAEEIPRKEFLALLKRFCAE